MVTLHQHQHRLIVVPPVPGVLDLLVTAEHEVANNDTQGCHVVRHARPLRAVDQTAFARVAEVVGEPLSIPDNETMAGYEPILRWLLEEKGFEVQSIPRLPQLPEPDVEAVQQGGEVDAHLLHGLRQHERLLVRHGPAVDVAWLVGEIGLAYPFASIVLAVASNGKARHFGEQIRRWLPDDVSVVTSDRPEPQRTGRIVVATHITLGCGAIGAAKRNIYIAPHAIDSLSRKGRMGLDEAFRARFIGMLPANERIAPRDEDELRGVYGFHEVHVPKHGYRVLPIDVIFIPMNGRRKLTHDASPADVKRQAVWRHAGRNARIATLASKLAQGDHAGLRRSFPQVAAVLAEAGPQRVGLLVDSVEHGVLLAQQLQGWALARASQVNINGLSRADQRILRERRPRPGIDDCQIITVAAADRIDLAHVDVLVRADAGTGLPAIPEEALVIDNSVQHRIVLVDLADRHHPVLRRWSRRRRQAYDAKGWLPPGTDPVQHRIDQFLNSRPRVA
jgi:hypothetical protein